MDISFFFSALAFGILREADEQPKIGWEILFSVCCVLGFLAHPLFVEFYLAAQVWSWLSKGNRSRWTQIFIFRTLLPGLFFAWLYFVNLHSTITGGGEVISVYQVVAQTLSLSVGGPLTAPRFYIAACVALIFLILALRHAFRQSFRLGAFYLFVVVLAPVLLQLLVQREPLYPRYFLGSVFFLLLLWAEYFGCLLNRNSKERWLACLGLGAFVLANSWHITDLILVGRGHYMDAVRTMEEQTKGSEILVLVDQPFREGMLLDQSIRTADLAKPIKMARPSAETVKDAEWALIESPSVDFIPLASMRTFGETFRLVVQYPFAGLSGWQLCLYRHEHLPGPAR